MTFTPIGRSQAQAYRVCLTLRQKYSYWTSDEPGGIPYLKWIDLDAMKAYRLICDLNKLPVEA